MSIATQSLRTPVTFSNRAFAPLPRDDRAGVEPQRPTPVEAPQRGPRGMPVAPGSAFDAAYWQHVETLSGGPLVHTPAPRFLHDNKEAFAARLALIKSATSSVMLSTYALECDEFGEQLLDALIERAKAGVPVCLKVDIHPEMFVSSEAKSDTKKRVYDKVAALSAAGGLVVEYGWRVIPNESFMYGDHMKALIVDGKAGIVGGRNSGHDDFGPAGSSDVDVTIGGTAVLPYGRRVADTLMRAWPREGFKDYGIPRGLLQLIEHTPETTPAVLNLRRQRFLTRFNADLARASNEAEARERDRIAAGGSPDTPLAVMTCNPELDAAHEAPGEQPNPITEAYIETIDRAKREIILSTNYINAGDATMAAIIRAAKRGVRVHIVTNGLAVSERSVLPYLNAHRWYDELRKAGVAIWETNVWSHRKLFVADGEVATIGSYNFELAAEEKLCEQATFTSDPAFVAEVRRTLRETILERCSPWVKDPPDHVWWHFALYPFWKLFTLGQRGVAYLLRKYV
jgi:phosphatidylserine/phosphatidylglycerophosphate/cardiolipin synthase-like enzyme